MAMLSRWLSKPERSTSNCMLTLPSSRLSLSWRSLSSASRAVVFFGEESSCCLSAVLLNCMSKSSSMLICSSIPACKWSTCTANCPCLSSSVAQSLFKTNSTCCKRTSKLWCMASSSSDTQPVTLSTDSLTKSSTSWCPCPARGPQELTALPVASSRARLKGDPVDGVMLSFHGLRVQESNWSPDSSCVRTSLTLSKGFLNCSAKASSTCF
mmetsp:Transcript_9522/g.21827  ORF Transcript_9522/g.21827 Transcript_9522/m.21827 type:complete len:211 (+) Transcript_9522:825-1457(+)